MIHDRQDIIGKTITGVITRGAGRGRNPSLVMLQFSDGSYFEFVSPAALTSLTRCNRNTDLPDSSASDIDTLNYQPQLAIFSV